MKIWKCPKCKLIYYCDGTENFCHKCKSKVKLIRLEKDENIIFSENLKIAHAEL